MTSVMMNDLVMDAGAMDKNWNRWAELGRGWAAFDRVYMTEAQVIALSERLRESSYFNSDYLLNPSIPEFTVITEEEGREENTYTCFRRTLMKPSDFIFPEIEGLVRTVEPAIDVYCYINNGGKLCNFVATLCKVTTEYQGQSMTSTAQVLTYYHEDPYTEWVITNNSTYLQEFLRTIKCVYLGVQMLSLERPEVMTAQTVREDYRTTVKKKGRYKAVNKTRFVKVIRITGESLADSPKGHHTITCPCWGVAGHMRTYKSGKQVWIKPYRKGKKRHDPSAYQPKEYEFPKEDTN